jgi:ABC-type methionine transport system ATPase subunit
MSTRTLRLKYPPSLLRQPILYRLIKQTDLAVNIQQARITLEEGWLEVELKGDDALIQLALDWLRQEGIEIEQLA